MKTFLLLAVIMPGFSQAYGKLAELADIWSSSPQERMPYQLWLLQLPLWPGWHQISKGCQRLVLYHHDCCYFHLEKQRCSMKCYKFSQSRGKISEPQTKAPVRVSYVSVVKSLLNVLLETGKPIV
jgi:hypothetical protein